MTPAPGRAVVVGGGIAGVTAALRLADAGMRVTLLEGRPRLGGLAFSFRRGDLTVDNGQHVYLRCCTAYRWFLERVGATDLAPSRTGSTSPSSTWPPPAAPPRPDPPRRAARTAPPGRRPRPLPPPLLAERARVARAALALKKLDPADPALDGIDFATWLGRHGQSPRAVAALWDLVGVATLNARAPQASMALAAMVFRTGLLSEPGAADIGWARVPLGDVHDTLARKALDEAGVATELSARVRHIGRGEDGRWRVDAGSGPWRPTPSSSPSPSARPTPCCRPARSTTPTGCSTSPRRPSSTSTSCTTARCCDALLRRPRHPVQWVFDRTEAAGVRQGQYLALSQSAVQDEIDDPVAALRERYLPELERLLPAARGARVLDFFVTRERNATFAPAPGVGRLRPQARTRAPGLYLAGAWTATGWPATMEGAVRSGFGAADAALSTLGRRHEHPLQEAA
ncbi:FAD-dependent oxidoreductase [Streptomyces zhihengii]